MGSSSSSISSSKRSYALGRLDSASMQPTAQLHEITVYTRVYAYVLGEDYSRRLGVRPRNRSVRRPARVRVQCVASRAAAGGQLAWNHATRAE